MDNKKLDFRNKLEQIMQLKVSPEMIANFHDKGLDLKNPNIADAVSASLVVQALCGNIAAFTTIRDTVGQKPVDKIENNTTIQVVLSDEVKRLGE